MLPALRASPDGCRQSFRQGLQDMLQQLDLGYFILACAHIIAAAQLQWRMLTEVSQAIALIKCRPWPQVRWRAARSR